MKRVGEFVDGRNFCRECAQRRRHEAPRYEPRMTGTKFCTDCKTDVHVTDFRVHRASPARDGRYNICSACAVAREHGRRVVPVAEATYDCGGCGRTGLALDQMVQDTSRAQGVKECRQCKNARTAKNKRPVDPDVMKTCRVCNGSFPNSQMRVDARMGGGTKNICLGCESVERVGYLLQKKRELGGACGACGNDDLSVLCLVQRPGTPKQKLRAGLSHAQVDKICRNKILRCHNCMRVDEARRDLASDPQCLDWMTVDPATLPDPRARIVWDAKVARGKCELCVGPPLDPTNLVESYIWEFDHIDPSTKLGNVSHMVTSRAPVEDIKAEIAKCRLAHRNCHAKRTAVQQGHYKHLPQAMRPATTSTGAPVNPDDLDGPPQPPAHKRPRIENEYASSSDDTHEDKDDDSET